MPRKVEKTAWWWTSTPSTRIHSRRSSASYRTLTTPADVMCDGARTETTSVTNLWSNRTEPEIGILDFLESNMIDSLQFARALERSDREAIVAWSGCPVSSCRAWLPASKIYVLLFTAVTVIEILPHCSHTYERQKRQVAVWKKTIYISGCFGPTIVAVRMLIESHRWHWLIS